MKNYIMEMKKSSWEREQRGDRGGSPIPILL